MASPFQQPARLTFQAIRCYLNQELQQLEALLSAAFRRLAPKGRVVLLCFKAAEVAAVRAWLRRNEDAPPVAAAWPIATARALYPLLQRSHAEQGWCALEVREPLRPSEEELKANTRARSARALVLEKRPRKGVRLETGLDMSRLLIERRGV